MQSLQSDIEFAREILRLEGEAVLRLQERVDRSFVEAVEAILACGGQLIVSGMGKSGFIAQKISATFASTGTPSIYLHPAEAAHGDLGRIGERDLVLLISNSGQTREILSLIDPIKTIGAKMIAITGDGSSELARHADIVLDLGQMEEADPLGLAPTTTTTATLALGDALCLAVLRHRDFTWEQFALYHPAGSLGRRLLRVEQLMRTGGDCAMVSQNSSILETILAISQARSGLAVCLDEEGRLVGVFTDGDLRRYLGGHQADIRRDILKNYMTRDPKTIRKGRLVSEALHIFKEYPIGELPVVDERGCPLGVLHVRDISRIQDL